MRNVICSQNDAATAPGGASFVAQVLMIAMELIIAQLVINLLIVLTGQGLLNILFYGFAIVLLLRFMVRAVGGSSIVLREDLLILQKKMGDTTTTVVEIPTEAIRAIYPVKEGEAVGLCYKQVSCMSRKAERPLRVKLAFWLCVLSSGLAERMIGRRMQIPCGHVVAFEEDGVLRACLFAPDEAMCRALAEHLPQAYGVDERLQRARLTGIRAQSLRRMCPKLYPYVEPLVSEADEEAAKAMLRENKKRRSAAPKAQKQPEQDAQQPAGRRRRRP